MVYHINKEKKKRKHTKNLDERSKVERCEGDPVIILHRRKEYQT